ncbi:twin-arginine translocase TatA/TatE family subunit [Streptomyces sp. NPDC050619]|uniref:twin-arginine translocase TatA/TatE family subunit n=1 Tax=Streptomyces sp. NPDC050619 TaxID=3157214 RepID=UPI00342C498C
MFGLSELAILLIIVIAVLAAKKLPELARSAGKSTRILKAEAEAEAKAETDATRVEGTPRVIQGEVVDPDTATPSPPSTPSAPS